MGNINQRQKIEVPITDYAGGIASALSELATNKNQLEDADNIVLNPQGKGFRSSPGNTEFNSVAMNSGAIGTGIGWFKETGGTEFLVAVAGDKVFKSDTLDGTMDDITSGQTITAGQSNLWTLVAYNNTMVGVGGASTDSPWFYNGSGNVVDITELSDSASFVFEHANRLFAGDGDSIKWNVLGDQTDWDGDGSGNATAGDGDGLVLTTGVNLNINQALLFKEGSTYILTGRAAPFPVHKLFANVGCIGKNAAVVADGLCYFITPKARMVITNGSEMIDDRQLPNLYNIDDKWKATVDSLLPELSGVRYTGKDFDWIIWSTTTTSGTQNTVAFIWDLKNKCWLQKTTGLESNGFVIVPNSGVLFMVSYDGKIYKCLDESVTAEASNSGSDVTWFIKSGALNTGSFFNALKIDKTSILYEAPKVSADIVFEWGYEVENPTSSVTLPILVQGIKLGEGHKLGEGLTLVPSKTSYQSVRTLGRGNYFRYRLSGSDAISYEISGISLWGKQSSQKSFGVK